MERRAYNHRSKQDLSTLRADLELLSPSQKSLATVIAMHAGLMRTPLVLRLTIFLMGFRYQKEMIVLLIAKQITSRAVMAQALWTDMMEHMVNGRDTYDRLSAGGWNKAELDTFIRIAEQVGWKRPAAEW